MSDNFLICPPSAAFDETIDNSWKFCSTVLGNPTPAWVVVSREDLAEYTGVEIDSLSIYDMLFQPQLTTADYLILYSVFSLYFATCWSFNVIAKQINPR